jgi:polyisoprenoid-binding protein YceI
MLRLRRAGAALARSTTLLAALALGACSLPAGREATPLPTTKPATAPSPTDTTAAQPATSTPVAVQRYQIDPAASQLRILVYKGGPMARLGHNHVISSQSLRGSIWRSAVQGQSGFEITVPVRELIVDDNANRTAEGPDFPLNLSEEDKAGTKTNMLRPSLLDGERFPDIVIRSVGVEGDGDTPEVVAHIRIKDQTREIRLPVRLEMAKGLLQVQGQFTLRQTDMGLTPLSVAMGALVVQDAVTIRFQLVARPGNSGP